MDEVTDEWRASFFLTDKDLTIDYTDTEGEHRNMVLEFQRTEESTVIDKVLQDPNFWVQIMNALSAALKRTA